MFVDYLTMSLDLSFLLEAMKIPERIVSGDCRNHQSKSDLILRNRRQCWRDRWAKEGQKGGWGGS